MGYESYEAPVRLVGLQAFPGFGFRQGRPYWVEFLRSLDAQLDGTPRQFVCDADPDIEAAIREVWPRGSEGAPEVFLCHHHLREAMLGKLKDARLALDDPLFTVAHEAFTNRELWDTFERAAREHRPRIRPLTTWLRRYGNRAAYQVSHHGGRVTDTTAVERYLADLRAQLGLRRAGLRNRRRLDCLLMLMMLQQRQPASRNRYMHVIRAQLLANAGHATTRRQVADLGARGSLRLMPPPRRELPALIPASPSYPADPEGDDIPF